MYKTIHFKKFSDGHGDLVPIEFGKKEDEENSCNIPFDVKRCYYISAPTDNAIRGKHAHYNLEQVIICIHGSFTLMLDDGKKKCSLNLDNNHTGIYIKDLVWRELKNFSESCVILVLASQHYDPDDYVRDYDTFLKLASC